MRAKMLLATAVACMIACIAVSQVGASERNAADTAFSGRQYEDAANIYKRVVRNDPSDSQSWFRLGFSLHEQKQYQDAIAAYKMAISQKYGYILARYNLACAYAMSGQADQALDTLEAAVAAGFTNAALMRSDTDLQSVRNTPRFQEIIQRAENPVLYYEQGRKLADLAGTWNVSSNNGPGRFLAISFSNGYSRHLDLVVSGSRVLTLTLFFVSADEEWRVVGADSLGSIYDSRVEFKTGFVACYGKLLKGGTNQEARVQIEFRVGSSAVLTMDLKKDGVWAPVRTYELVASAK